MSSLADLPDSCEGEIRLHIPEEFRRGELQTDERASINSAIINLKTIGALTERPDWSSLNVLDYGCGVKFAQTLIQYEVDVRNYVGMDVFRKMIQCLNERINRPNFQFYHVPFRNDRYSPKGIELTGDAELPGNIHAYDLITLQSVFTHFRPKDFLAMLQVLRRYVASDARLFFTCFIDNTMEVDFIDRKPHRPLLQAYYKEEYIRDMLNETGWDPLLLRPPSSWMQHHFVCEPRSL